MLGQASGVCDRRALTASERRGLRQVGADLAVAVIDVMSAVEPPDAQPISNAMRDVYSLVYAQSDPTQPQLCEALRLTEDGYRAAVQVRPSDARLARARAAYDRFVSAILRADHPLAPTAPPAVPPTAVIPPPATAAGVWAPSSRGGAWLALGVAAIVTFGTVAAAIRRGPRRRR